MDQRPTTDDRRGGDVLATARPRRPRRRGLELGALAVVGVLLIAAFATGGSAAYRTLYGATAFVERYLGLLASGRAADALALPGVDEIASSRANAGSRPASDALLRRAALAGLSDVEPISEEVRGDITRVTVAYRAGNVDGRSTFEIRQDGWIGIAPAWRFARSPLTVMNLTVRGSTSFEVNGFEIDRRQVASTDEEADPLAPLPLLVFSPGLYSVSVDTRLASTPGAAVLADAPSVEVPVDIQAEPTDEFASVVRQRVEEFLTGCAAQQVLQPTGCPFGLRVRNRILDPPTWSITEQPRVEVAPGGAGWRILPADAVAHVEVDIRLLADGSLRHVSEDVPFRIEGAIEVRADDSVSITVSGGNTED